MKNSIEKWVTIFLLSASIFVSVLLVEATVLALMNQFKIVYIYFSLIPALAIAMLFCIPIKRDVNLLPKISLPAVAILLLISYILIFYPHDTFGGRDESIYSNLASHLVSSSSLKFQPYLNNLQDNYVEKVQTWHQGYPVWLGIQQILFGTHWMLRSNVIIIILGLFSFFLVSSHLGGNKIGLISTILFSSSMPFLWFSRETMSENLSFFLLWSMFLFLLSFLKTKNHNYLIPVIICSWLFGLTRFEGFLLQFVLLFGLPLLLLISKTSFKKNSAILIIYIFVLITNVYIAQDMFLPSYLKNDVPQVSSSIKRDISLLISTKFEENNNLAEPNVKSKTLFYNYPNFIFQMVAKYNFVLVIYSILLIFIQFVFRFKEIGKSKKLFFIILILLIPEYYKLISPNVTLDLPWLYRRYMYALLPFGYVCFLVLLDNFNNKKLVIILLSALFIINITLSSPILFLKNNWKLIDKLNEISVNISKNDFIIIEKSPLGYYSPGSFLVLNKGVRNGASSVLWANEFIPESKIFGGIPYNKLFLLSSNDQEVNSAVDLVSSKVLKTPIFSSFDIISSKSVEVEYFQLVPSCQLYLLGEKIGSADIYDIGSLPFSSVAKYCGQPTNEIVKHKDKLFLYELIYKGKN